MKLTSVLGLMRTPREIRRGSVATRSQASLAQRSHPAQSRLGVNSQGGEPTGFLRSQGVKDLERLSSRWFTSKSANFVLAFLCFAISLRHILVGSSVLDDLAGTQRLLRDEGLDKSILDIFHRFKDRPSSEIQGRLSSRRQLLIGNMFIDHRNPTFNAGTKRENQRGHMAQMLFQTKRFIVSQKSNWHSGKMPDVDIGTGQQSRRIRAKNEMLKHTEPPREQSLSKKMPIPSKNVSVEVSFVHSRITTNDPRFDFISTGKDKKMPSKAFLWHGKELCYDSLASQFVVSRYKRPQGFVPKTKAHMFPDRWFIKRDISLHEVSRWYNGATIIPYNFPLNETKAHFLMRIGNIFHLYRYSRNNLKVPIKELKILFDNMNIPQDRNHRVQKELFEALFSEIPQENRIGRNKLQGVVCFENVILHNWQSTPSLRMSLWPADLRYLRNLVSKWESSGGVSTKLRQDCASGKGFRGKSSERIVWIVQRRTKLRSREITNMDALKERVRKIFGPYWKVVEFDSANTPCKIFNRRRCLGYPICPSPRPDLLSSTCQSVPSLSREIRLFNKIDIMIGIHGATFMNAMYMPEGATVVEIFPAGIEEYVYASFAQRARLSYIGWREPNTTELVHRFPQHRKNGCFRDATCRHVIRSLPVTVSVDRFEPIIRKARDLHAMRCLGMPSHDLVGTNFRMGAPGEPKWMHTS